MHKQFKLKSGLSLMVVPMKGTKTVTMMIMVGTGSKYEDKKTSGISHFVEHMLFKGTKKRPTTLKLTSELDGLGSEYNAFTGKEYTGYWVKVGSAHAEKAIDVVSDMFLNSKIDAEEIARERNVIVEEINMYEDNPMMYVEDVFEQCLYGDTPAGWDTAGSKDNVLAMKQADLAGYLQRQYGIGNTYVVVAGDIRADQKTVGLVEKYFPAKLVSKRGVGFKEKKAVHSEQKKPQIRIKYKETDQAHISLGVRSHKYGHRDEYALKLLSVLLGGSMSSRLFMNLRERNGLCYYVRTSSELYSDAGYISTQAGVPVDKIEKAIKIVLAEYQKLTADLVPARELDRTKDLICGRSTLQLESSDDVANWYARQAVMIGTVARTDKKFAKKIGHPEDFFKAIRRVTSADIRRVARDVFRPENLNLAIIGPFKDEVKFKKLLKF